ncbi:MAG: hypothetical protein ABI793_03395 [Flavobacterium sp.]
MKTRFFLIILFCPFVALKAQEKAKDTLFFSVDKYYTISPTLIPNFLKKVAFPEIIDFKKELMSHTKTNGHIYFIGDGFLTKGLKPKKILSIKEYVENRKFYLDGEYNKIVDEGKLRDSLTNKYTIFFVNGDEFISPRVLEYYSYYPIREGDNFIQNKIKDTLYFTLDNEYVYKPKNRPDGIADYYLIKDSSSDEVFYFKELETVNFLKPKKILSLKEFVRSSRFYDKNQTHKLSEVYFMKFLMDYVIYLVDDKNKFIKVAPLTVMED